MRVSIPRQQNTCTPAVLSILTRNSMANASVAVVLRSACAALLIVSGTAFATAQRTFVASYGNDANPCTLTQPCRGFAAAIAQANAGGEVIVLDSAGYGRVDITQSVSIIAPPGIYAGITVPLGTSGVNVNGAGTSVVLRGLTVDGSTGNIGIQFTGDTNTNFIVEDCEISNMLVAGIEVNSAGTVMIRNTRLRHNQTGIHTHASVVTVDSVRVADSVQYGVLADDGTTMTIVNSVLSGNKSVGVRAFTVSSTTSILISQSTISGSPKGAVVAANTGKTAYMTVAGNTFNGAAAAFTVGGAGGIENIYTAGNNTDAQAFGVSIH